MSLTVIASSSLSPGLRGAMTKWYIEVMPGIFVGTVNPRVRDEIWNEVERWVTNLSTEAGYAALIQVAPTEQGFTIRTAGTNRYLPADFDGITLVSRRHNPASLNSGTGATSDPNDWGF